MSKKRILKFGEPALRTTQLVSDEYLNNRYNEIQGGAQIPALPANQNNLLGIQELGGQKLDTPIIYSINPTFVKYSKSGKNEILINKKIYNNTKLYYYFKSPQTPPNRQSEMTFIIDKGLEELFISGWEAKFALYFENITNNGAIIIASPQTNNQSENLYKVVGIIESIPYINNSNSVSKGIIKFEINRDTLLFNGAINIVFKMHINGVSSLPTVGEILTDEQWNAYYDIEDKGYAVIGEGLTSIEYNPIIRLKHLLIELYPKYGEAIFNAIKEAYVTEDGLYNYRQDFTNPFTATDEFLRAVKVFCHNYSKLEDMQDYYVENKITDTYSENRTRMDDYTNDGTTQGRTNTNGGATRQEDTTNETLFNAILTSSERMANKDKSTTSAQETTNSTGEVSNTSKNISKTRSEERVDHESGFNSKTLIDSFETGSPVSTFVSNFSMLLEWDTDAWHTRNIW